MNLEAMKLEAEFAVYLDSGMTIDLALTAAVTELVKGALQLRLRGVPFAAAIDGLARAGIRDERITDLIVTPTRVERLNPFIYGLVTGTGGVLGVPTPGCIQAHLPTDRPPTRDEILRAWEACTRA